MNETRRLIRVKTAAKILSCSKSLIYKLGHAGEIIMVKLGDRGLRCVEASLYEYIDRDTIEPEEKN